MYTHSSVVVKDLRFEDKDKDKDFRLQDTVKDKDLNSKGSSVFRMQIHNT